MRQFSSVSAIAKSVAFLFVIGFTVYGTRFALGGDETRSADAHVASERGVIGGGGVISEGGVFSEGGVIGDRGAIAEGRLVYANHETAVLPTRPEVVVDDGAEIYMTRCMSCHQMNGRGVPGVFPPLAGTEWVTGDKGQLIRVVLNGLTGEIDVEGEKYSGAMPPWQSFLDDEQVASLLTYIRTSWGNEASEVTAAEVGEVRAATKDRRDPWTQAELEKEDNRGIPGQKEAEGAAETTKDGAAKSDTSKTGEKK